MVGVNCKHTLKDLLKKYRIHLKVEHVTIQRDERAAVEWLNIILSMVIDSDKFPFGSLLYFQRIAVWELAKLRKYLLPLLSWWFQFDTYKPPKKPDVYPSSNSGARGRDKYMLPAH